MKFDKGLVSLAMTSIALVLTCCQRRVSTVLDDPDCSPPCWNEIVPGVTSPEEALSYLSSSPEIDQGNKEFEISRGYWSWLFTPGYSESSGRIYFNELNVYEIALGFDRPVPINKIIEIYGDPQFVSFISGWADTKWMLFVFLYPDRGIALKSFDFWFWPDRDDVRIGQATKIEEIYFFEPGMLWDENTLSRIFLLDADESTVQESLQDWHGYGRYQYTSKELR
jgi:hypothetical protein